MINHEIISWILTSISLGYIYSRVANKLCREGHDIYNKNNGRNYSDEWYEGYATRILISIQLLYFYLRFIRKDDNLIRSGLISGGIFSIYTLVSAYRSIDRDDIAYLSFTKNIFEKNPKYKNGPSFFKYIKKIIPLYVAIGVLSGYLQKILNEDPYKVNE